jgi:hypothetical protein
MAATQYAHHFNLQVAVRPAHSDVDAPLVLRDCDSGMSRIMGRELFRAEVEFT